MGARTQLGADAPEAGGSKGRADAGGEAPRRVRLHVTLPIGLHHRVGTWARWTRSDVSRLVEEFLAEQVRGFEVRGGKGG